MAARTFREREREREREKSRAFFDVISDVYTHVDNRDEFRRKKNMKIS